MDSARVRREARWLNSGLQSKDLQLLVAGHENLASKYHRNQVGISPDVGPGAGLSTKELRHCATPGLGMKSIEKNGRIGTGCAREGPNNGIGQPIR
jgi:hypothetical protein